MRSFKMAMSLLALLLLGGVAVAQDAKPNTASDDMVAARDEDVRHMRELHKFTHVNPWDIEATLTWRGGEDLDLRVADPTQCEISYEYPLSTSGGLHLGDVVPRCSDKKEVTETVVWKLGGAIPGIYAFKARVFRDCNRRPIRATLRIKMGGVEVHRREVEFHRAGDEHVWYVHAHRVNTIYGKKIDYRGFCDPEDDRKGRSRGG